MGNIVEKTFLSLLFTSFQESKKLKCCITDCFKTNGKQRYKMQKNVEYARFKNHERKIKSPFMIYADLRVYWFQKIMGSKIQTSLIQTNIKNNFGYKLVFIGEKFSGPLKSCLGKDSD